MTPWFKNVTPHQDLCDGVLDESVFAADLSEVAIGKGRPVYAKPELFFSKTYFTVGLKTICKRVIDGLNGKIDSGDRSVSLQTGFGGGKTHSLIALYHIAKQGKSISKLNGLKDMLAYSGPISFAEGNVAVFTNKTCDPTTGRKVGGLTIKTIWGEIAYQLGGKAAYEIIRENDEKQTCPKGLFKEVLIKCSPALILIDELADYCVSASAVTVGKSTLCDQTISFAQELSEAVVALPHCVLVATLPASPVEVASSQLGTHILTSLSNRLSRVSADTKPVNDEEIFEVLRRRLFESIDDDKIVDDVATNYETLYQSWVLELPSFAPKAEYREKIKKLYPFHPALIEVSHKHWASHHDFQRTRGALRLLASIVSDLWQRQNSLVGDVKSGDVHQEIVSRLSARTQLVSNFNVLIAPSEEVPEQKTPTLIILHPKYQINGGDIATKPLGDMIRKLATKKGNGDRVYRNTLLFLICSEVGFTKVHSDITEYLACVKIRDEYQSQLEQEQKADIKGKIESHNQSIDRSIASAYTVVAKHCVQKGIQTIAIKQFKDLIDCQIDSVIHTALIDEEWLLQKVGLSELKRQNLLPTAEAPIRTEGQFAIASGEATKFTRYYLKEPIPFLDVTEPTYWLFDKSQIPAVSENSTTSGPTTGGVTPPADTVKEDKGTGSGGAAPKAGKAFKSITISGKVAPENYSQIFSSFVQPLINNKIEIKIEIKGKATDASPISENTQNFKIAKESASQLGLTFNIEE